MKALIIVDVQVDFCPGGALPAPDGNKIIPIINNLMDKFCLVVASRDWHPQNSKHFEKWPVHCVLPGFRFLALRGTVVLAVSPVQSFLGSLS